MEATLFGGLDLDDNLFEQRTEARLLGVCRMDLTGLGKDGQAPSNPLCTFQQSNGVLQYFLSIVCGKQSKAHGNRQRRFKI